MSEGMEVESRKEMFSKSYRGEGTHGRQKESEYLAEHSKIQRRRKMFIKGAVPDVG